MNHRTGLFDAVMIKDNHLLVASTESGDRLSPGQAIDKTRQFLEQFCPEQAAQTVVEVEVDTLEQLDEVLPHRPDIVLLDNMDCGTLRDAVVLRNSAAPGVLLEASGGVSLETVADVARTGVDRISVGGLTHSAPALDIAFDWPDRPGEARGR